MVLIDHSQAVQTTRQTTTSSTYVDIPSVSIADTFFNTGDKYLIIASAQLDAVSASDETGTRTVHGTSTQFDGSEHFVEHAPGSVPKRQDYFYWTVWTAVAGEGVKVQFKINGAGLTGADQVVLTAIRLNDLTENTDWHFDENLTDTTLTTSFSTTNNAVITFTPPNAGDNWLILSRAHTLTDTGASNQLIGRFSRSGEATFNSSTTSQEREIVDLIVAPNMHVFNLGAVSNTFTQESRVDETNASDLRTDSAIFAINLASFQDSSSSATTTGVATLTTTDFGDLVETVNITPTTTVDVFILGSYIGDTGTTSGNEARIQVDNVDSPATQTSDAYERNDGFDGKDIHDFFHQTIINLDNTLHTVDMDASSTASGPGVLNSSLVAFTLETAVPPSPQKTFIVDALIEALGDNGACPVAGGESVQSGTAQIPTASATQDVAITAVDLSKSLVVFNYRVDSTDPSRFLVKATLTTTTNIRFERDNTSGTNTPVDITWYVVESNDLTVQRGNNSMTTAISNQTITAVDLSKAFRLTSIMNNGTGWGQDDLLKSRLTTTTNLELETNAVVNLTDSVTWQVAEFTGAVVQRGIAVIDETMLSADVTITSVDLTRSFVLIDSSLSGDTANTANGSLRATLTTATNLHIERGSFNATDTHSIAWEVVELPVGTTVQSGTESFTTLETQNNVTITAVSLTNAFVILSSRQREGQSSDLTDSNPHSAWFTAELTTTTNLQLTRASADSSTASVEWQIIEVAGGGIAGIQRACAEVDAILVTVQIEEFIVDAILVGAIKKTFEVNSLIEAQGDNGNCGAVVQKGSITIPAGTISVNQTINPIVLNDSFLFLTSRADSSVTSQFLVKGELTSTTNILFIREELGFGPDAPVDIIWYIVEFPERITSQRGLTDHTGAGNPFTEGQLLSPAVALNDTFTHATWFNFGQFWGDDDMLRLELTSPTNLDIESFADLDHPAGVFWQTISYKGANVQRGNVTFNTGTLTTDITINKVRLESTILNVTNTQDQGSGSPPNETSLQATLINDTTLRIERNSGSVVNMELSWEVVEFPPQVRVQAGTETFGTTEMTKNITINKVDLDQTVASLSWDWRGGRGDDTTDDNPRSVWFTAEATTPTNLQLIRASSASSTANVTWCIIEFAPEQHACAEVDAILTPIHTFEVDACIEGEFIHEFIVNAIIVNRFIEEFVVSPLIKDTFIEEFRVDAILEATFIEEFVVSPLIVDTFIEEFVVSPLIKDTFIEEFRVDALLQATFIEEFFVGKLIVAEQLINFRADALILADQMKFTVADGLVVEQDVIEEFFVNAIIVNRFIEEFEVDAIIVNRFIEEFEVNAIIVNRFIEEFFVNALLQATFIEEFVVSPLIEATFVEEFVVSPLIKDTFIEEFVVSPLIVATFIEEFVASPLIVDTFIEEFVAGKLIVAQDQEKEFFVDGITDKSRFKFFRVDGIVDETLKRTFRVNAIVKAFGLEEEFITDAILVVLFKDHEFRADAILEATFEEEFIVSPLLEALGQEHDFFVNGLVFVLPVELFTVSPLIALLDQEKEFFVNANLRFKRIKEFIVDAVILRTGDVLCSTPAFSFSDDFSSDAGWTNNGGTNIQIDTGSFPDIMRFNQLFSQTFGIRRAFKTLDNSIITAGNFTWEFEHNHFAGGTSFSSNWTAELKEDTSDVTTTTADETTIRYRVHTITSTGPEGLRLEVYDKNGINSVTSATSIILQDNRLYFPRITKVGGIVKLELFTDSARTIQASGSPLQVDANGFDFSNNLNIIYFGNIGTGGSARRAQEEFDNITIVKSVCPRIEVDAVLQGFDFELEFTVDARLALRIFTEVNALVEEQGILKEFRVDANLIQLGTFIEFKVDAIIQSKITTSVDALIKAEGDVRCQPTFAEKIFEDDLNDTSNWSDEINSTTVDGWATQRIFIDGEDPVSEDNGNGFIHASMLAGGFGVGDFPVFKTKYRRKLIGSEGGIGVVQGDSFRIEFELHQTAKGEGAWLGLNKRGFHPENDPNTSTFQVNSGDGSITSTLADGLGNTATTPDLVWSPANEESPDPLFIVVESVGGQLILNAYDDAGHTIHNGNSPVNVSTTSIDTDELAMVWLFTGANSKFSDPNDPTAVADIDNILIYSNPCPRIQVDAQLKEVPIHEFIVNAQLIRQIQIEVDAQLRGRKDFEVDAKLVRRFTFEVNAILNAPIDFEFFVNAILLDNFDKDFFVNAILARVKVFEIDAVLSTVPEDPNFSENHMLDVVPQFSGIADIVFQVDAQLRGSVSIEVDARLAVRIFTEVDAFLSTVPQALIFSDVHLQDITPIVAISQNIQEFFVSPLIQELGLEHEFEVHAILVDRNIAEPIVDAILNSITKTHEFKVDALLEAFGQEEEFFVNAIIVNRFIEEPEVNSLLQATFEEEFRVDSLIKKFDQDEQFFVNVILISRNIEEFRVDAIIKRLGDNGICNFFPEPFTTGTGFERTQTPLVVAHEQDVDIFIGQQFTLNNQQIRGISLLLRGNQAPFSIEEDSIIQGKIWANVVKGSQAGETVVATSVNSVNANISSGDLPAGEWKNIEFTFDRDLTPFITGDFLIGIEHFVGAGVNDPEGVGVAEPAQAGSNVIAGEALFRRSANSSFPDPDTWNLLLGDELDMIINIELVNGNEILVGEGRQCPVADAFIQATQLHEFKVDATLIPRNIHEFVASPLIQQLGNEEEFIVNGILAPIKTFEVDAQLLAVGFNDEEFFVNARILLIEQIPTKVDAVLFNIGDNLETFVVSPLIEELGVLKLFRAGKLIQALGQEEEFFVNALLQQQDNDKEFIVNARLKKLDAEQEFFVNAILSTPAPPHVFRVDAQLADDFHIFFVDVLISKEKEIEFFVNVILSPRDEKEFFVNALLEATFEEEFRVDGNIQADQDDEFRVNAILQKQDIEEFFVNALLKQVGIEKDFRIDALLNKSQKFQVDGLKVALGTNGNNGGTNQLAVNPFIDQSQSVTGIAVPTGTNLCGQRLRLPTAPVIIISFRFRMFRDGLSGSPTGTLQGKIYRNSIEGTPISSGDLIDSSDNIVQLSDLTTNVLGDNVVFTFSTHETEPDDNIFVGIQITGTNEEVFFNVEGLGTVIEGGDFTTESAGNWGADSGVDANMQITIDDEPRQRGSAIVSAILGLKKHEFEVDSVLQGFDLEKEFRVNAIIVNPREVEFTINARLIGSVDVEVDAFIGEVQTTVLEVESVVVTNNSDFGNESTIGVGAT